MFLHCCILQKLGAACTQVRRLWIWIWIYPWISMNISMDISMDIHGKSVFLAELYNKSLKTGDVPEEWKLANVTPIFKKGKRSRPSSAN